jgi:putative lipoic acid-binding regulatory protein
MEGLTGVSSQPKSLLMSQMPALDLLESTHRFPCAYIFKVIGRVDDGFAARVVAAVRDVLAQSVDPPFSCRHTAGGRHVAVTLTPIVQTGHQVLAVYQRIQQTRGLVMCF